MWFVRRSWSPAVLDALLCGAVLLAILVAAVLWRVLGL
jgi:hypothetical protein